MRSTAIRLLLALAACGRDSDAQTGGQPLAIRIEPAGDSSRLVLTAAPGWKIGARLKPALEAGWNPKLLSLRLSRTHPKLSRLAARWELFRSTKVTGPSDNSDLLAPGQTCQSPRVE